MENYLETFHQILQNPGYFVIVFVGLYFFWATLDTVLGITKAIFTNDDEFSSRVAQLGIVRKLVTMLVMICAVPLTMIFPFEIGYYMLSLLYIALVVSEAYSVAGHLGFVKDGNKGKKLVSEIFERLLSGVVKEKEK